MPLTNAQIAEVLRLLQRITNILFTALAGGTPEPAEAEMPIDLELGLPRPHTATGTADPPQTPPFQGPPPRTTPPEQRTPPQAPALRRPIGTYENPLPFESRYSSDDENFNTPQWIATGYHEKKYTTMHVRNQEMANWEHGRQIAGTWRPGPSPSAKRSRRRQE